MAELWDKIGAWSFIAGLVIALIFAIISPGSWAIWFLGALGLIIGLLNVKDKEVQGFLLASVAFVVSSTSLAGVFTVAGGGNAASTIVAQFLTNIANILGPAAAIVAIKELYSLAKD